MENFDLNKLYYDKDGTKLYGRDMEMLAINKLFIGQRTFSLKVFSWIFLIGAITFYQFFFFETYKYIDSFFYDILCFCASIAAIYALLVLITHGGSYLMFSNTEEFKKRSTGLDSYKSAFKKMSSVAKNQRFCRRLNL
jgi:hypothetical protein